VNQVSDNVYKFFEIASTNVRAFFRLAWLTGETQGAHQRMLKKLRGKGNDSCKSAGNCLESLYLGRPQKLCKIRNQSFVNKVLHERGKKKRDCGNATETERVANGAPNDQSIQCGQSAYLKKIKNLLTDVFLSDCSAPLLQFIWMDTKGCLPVSFLHSNSCNEIC